jgi:putative ABC transport system permease protein
VKALLQAISRRCSLPLGLQILRFRLLNLVTALAAVAFAASLMLTQWGFRDALFSSSVAIQKLFQADVILISWHSVSTLTWMSTFPDAYLSALRADRRIADTTTVRIGYMRWTLEGQHTARLSTALGVEPGHADFFTPSLARAASLLQMPGRLLFDRLSRPEYGDVERLLQAGQPVQAYLEEQRVRVVGVLDIGASFGADATTIMSRESFETILPGLNNGEVEIGLIRLQPGTDRSAFLRDQQQRLPADVRLLSPEQFVRFEQDFWDRSKPIGFIFFFGVLMGMVIGGSIIFLVLNTIILLHIDDFATLMAIGYSRWRLQLVIFNQAIILSLLGYPLGLAISEAIYALTRLTTRLPMQMTFGRAITVFLLTVALCAVSGILSLRRLNETSPADAFS